MRGKTPNGTGGPPPPAAGNADFPIVGIGASAGGLEALEQFLGHVPTPSGMAFVVILHLDPTRHGVMPELLQRVTAMGVLQVKNRMKVKPDCVYVIPPNKDLSIRQGVLYLTKPADPRGLRLPIDLFFHSLAEDRRGHGVAVVLSGMGSDGTKGLQAVKATGGLVLAQEPASAKFDGMPRSAIATGLVDIVAPAHELPLKIAAHLGRPPPVEDEHAADEPDGGTRSGALQKILALLRTQTGHDFSLYKKSTIYRRIERRMEVHRIDRIAGYAHFLETNSQELQLLFKELLIGVTSFFRDPGVWALLQERVLPALLAQRPVGRALRAWVAGCSTGEEAYSLAIAFREVLDGLRPKGRFSLQIFATDLDPDAINKARRGWYPASITADVSPQRLAHFFVEDGNGYRVSTEIREMVVFAPQNAIMDPPFTKLDILSCRNLLIYLGPELQKKLLPLFHYSLNPDGILLLGNAESVGGFSDLFTPIDAKARLFQRSANPMPPLEVEFPTRETVAAHPPAHAADSDNVPSLQAVADHLLLQHFAPAAVLVNGNGDVLYISGRTGNYLEPAAGKANWNIHAMARNLLRHELAFALPRALRMQQSIFCHDVGVETAGGMQRVDLTVYPIDQPPALRGMAMIVFTGLRQAPAADEPEDKRKPARGKRVAQLEAELQAAREEIQKTREEMQSSHEELKSANEEFQSTNEELQSTIEELTTSKEELQSLNEEMQTVNAELQSKVDELSSTNNDMKNLLNSTDIATIFLDEQLHVRRFTTRATRLFKLIPGDVGRPLSDIVTVLRYPAQMADAQEVLRSLTFTEKQIADEDGGWFAVKIMPYRTVDNIIDGVVITFSDITAAKRLEAELRGARDQARAAGGEPAP